MRILFLVISALCAVLMVGGLIGFTLSGEEAGIPVPPPGTGVGFGDEPLEGLPLSDFLVDAELTMTWEADVWVGIVTEEERNRCAPDGGWSNNCGGSSTDWAAGGPSTVDSKSLSWTVEDGTFYAADGQPFSSNADSTFDVAYEVDVTASTPLLLIIGLTGTACLVMAFRS